MKDSWVVEQQRGFPKGQRVRTQRVHQGLRMRERKALNWLGSIRSVVNLSVAFCHFLSDYGARACTKPKECERFPEHIVIEWLDLLFCSDAILGLNSACCRGKFDMPNRPKGCHTSRKVLSVTESSSLKWLEYQEPSLPQIKLEPSQKPTLQTSSKFKKTYQSTGLANHASH
jgi:hypothetical protein